MALNQWVTWGYFTLLIGVITYNPTYSDRRVAHLVDQSPPRGPRNSSHRTELQVTSVAAQRVTVFCQGQVSCARPEILKGESLETPKMMAILVKPEDTLHFGSSHLLTQPSQLTFKLLRVPYLVGQISRLNF